MNERSQVKKIKSTYYIVPFFFLIKITNSDRNEISSCLGTRQGQSGIEGEELYKETQGNF